ncbi:pyocin knob domain-containing protein [Citrobacter portucalensis]|uniref:pyocin knob domain-containing protein n=1 Tax=Citrobacter portucalensis TaxID=1639133 RepID=UPI003EE07867
MTPELAKLKQRVDARRRSQQAPRRASSQAVSSDQSEVTEEAPAVYRVPQINVPEDLQGVAKLIQTELAKIEQSQSILLSLWEKVKDQINSQTEVKINKKLRVMGDVLIERDPNNQAGYFGIYDKANDLTGLFGYGGTGMNMSWQNFNANSSIEAHAGELTARYQKPYYTDGEANEYTLSYFPNSVQKFLTSYSNGSVINVPDRGDYLTGDMNYAPMDSIYFAYRAGNAINGPPKEGVCIDVQGLNYGYRLQLIGGYADNAIYYRTHNGDYGTWGEWRTLATTAALEGMRLNLKAEIYAELLALNPGIVIPQTD